MKRKWRLCPQHLAVIRNEVIQELDIQHVGVHTEHGKLYRCLTCKSKGNKSSIFFQKSSHYLVYHGSEELKKIKLPHRGGEPFPFEIHDQEYRHVKAIPMKYTYEPRGQKGGSNKEHETDITENDAHTSTSGEREHVKCRNWGRMRRKQRQLSRKAVAKNSPVLTKLRGFKAERDELRCRLARILKQEESMVRSIKQEIKAIETEAERKRQELDEKKRDAEKVLSDLNEETNSVESKITGWLHEIKATKNKLGEASAVFELNKKELDSKIKLLNEEEDNLKKDEALYFKRESDTVLARKRLELLKKTLREEQAEMVETHRNVVRETNEIKAEKEKLESERTERANLESLSKETISLKNGNQKIVDRLQEVSDLKETICELEELLAAKDALLSVENRGKELNSLLKTTLDLRNQNSTKEEHAAEIDRIKNLVMGMNKKLAAKDALISEMNKTAADSNENWGNEIIRLKKIISTKDIEIRSLCCKLEEGVRATSFREENLQPIDTLRNGAVCLEKRTLDTLLILSRSLMVALFDRGQTQIKPIMRVYRFPENRITIPHLKSNGPGKKLMQLTNKSLEMCVSNLISLPRRTVFIDGGNVCHQGEGKNFKRALPFVEYFRKIPVDVVLVFSKVQEKFHNPITVLKDSLEKVQLCYADNRYLSDVDCILSSAIRTHGYVISNDFFQDFTENPANPRGLEDFLERMQLLWKFDQRGKLNLYDRLNKKLINPQTFFQKGYTESSILAATSTWIASSVTTRFTKDVCPDVLNWPFLLDKNKMFNEDFSSNYFECVADLFYSHQQ